MLTTPPAHNATAQQTGRPRSSSTVQKGSRRTTSLEEHGRSRAVSPQQPWSRPRAVSGVQAVHEGHAASKIFVRLFTEDNNKHDFLPKNAAGLVERIVVQANEALRRGKGCSLKTFAFFLSAGMVCSGILCVIDGLLNREDLLLQMLSSAIGRVSIGLSLVLTGLMAAVATCCSRNRVCSLLVLLFVSVVASVLAVMSSNMSSSWRDSLSMQGDDVRLSLASNDQLHEKVQSGFTSAFDSCNGSVYNTTRVNQLCAVYLNETSSCTRNEPGHFALYCRHPSDVSFVSGRQREPGHALHYSPERNTQGFGWFVSRYCFPQDLRNLSAIATSKCYASRWWQTPPPTRGAKFEAGSSEAETALFNALGEGELELNPKLIFCACEASLSYVSLLSDFLSNLQDLSVSVSWLCLVSALILLCFCCCCNDTDEYYDPELL